MRKHADQLNWKYISTFQTLSSEFTNQFKDKLDMKLINMQKKLSGKFKEDYIKRLRQKY